MKDEIAIKDPKGGSNQSGLRDQNARLVLSFIRRHGAMPSAEIARRSGLSAQTVSNIMRALEADGLIRRGEAIKGKVGKPSVPMSLNPEGVYSLGLSIGRRSAELELTDFLGQHVDVCSTAYDFPSIDGVFGFLEQGLEALLSHRPDVARKLAGIGVSRPNRIWNWLEVVGAPATAMDAWKEFDITAEIARRTGLESHIENDITAACVAEHLLGRGREFADFAYIFVGAFVGGGLVLDGKIVPGRTNNAAALGPLPVPDGKGGVTQLLNVASVHVLERRVRRSGRDPLVLHTSTGDWRAFEPEVTLWIRETAQNLAVAAASIASVVEVEAILIDGAFPQDVRQRLACETGEAFGRLDLTGIETPRLEEATIGRGARSVGAALLPIHARYFLA